MSNLSDTLKSLSQSLKSKFATLQNSLIETLSSHPSTKDYFLKQELPVAREQTQQTQTRSRYDSLEHYDLCIKLYYSKFTVRNMAEVEQQPDHNVNPNNTITEQDNQEPQQGQHPIKVWQQVCFLFLGMSTWASYPYCFDIPQAVETQMKLPPYNLSSSEFNYLYVCISIPNIVLSFIAAIITTKIGPIRAICLYVVMLMVGQGIITWAAYSAEGGWYWFMLIGRVLMGTSGYSLVGANLALIPKYTEAKYVSLFIGLGSMFPWTTQSLTALFSPIIYDQTKKVYLPFFVGWITILYSIAANVLIVFTDRKFSKRYRKQDQAPKPPKITIQMFRELGIIMLMVFIIIAFAVSIQGAIIINANDMLHVRSGFTNVQAGPIAMMPLLVNCLTSPMWAFIKEKVTHKRRLLPIIGLILFVDIIILYFLPEEINGFTYFMAYLGFILLGLWDSGAVTLIVGSIPQILPSKLQTLGFSVYTAALAVGMGISPIITGAIIDNASSTKQGYKNCFYLFFGEFVVTMTAICYVWLTNNAQAQLIEKPLKDQQKEALMSKKHENELNL